jgi:hypothetical protein
LLLFDLVKIPINYQIKNTDKFSFNLKTSSTLILETKSLHISNKIADLSSLKNFQYSGIIKLFNKYIFDNSIGLIHIFTYSIYFIFLLLALSFCNIFSLKLDKQSIIIIKNYGADKNLLMSILFRRIIYNTLLGFLIGWLFIFILLHILYLTASTSSNTIQFINIKNINSFFYFLSLLIMILCSQYIIISKMVSKYMRIEIE